MEDNREKISPKIITTEEEKYDRTILTINSIPKHLLAAMKMTTYPIENLFTLTGMVFMWGIIILPYLFLSKRAKCTFVKGSGTFWGEISSLYHNVKYRLLFSQ